MKSRILRILAVSLPLAFGLSCAQRLQCTDKQVTNLVSQTIRNKTARLIETSSVDRGVTSKMLQSWMEDTLEISGIKTTKVDADQSKCWCEAELVLSSAGDSRRIPLNYIADFNRRTEELQVEVLCDLDAVYQWAARASGSPQVAK